MRVVRHGATPDDALHAIEGYLERDTPWEEVDKLIDIFAKKGGYEEKHISTPFEIFTKCLKVTKKSVGETKWRTIRERYYKRRRELEREMRDEGLSLRAIADRVGVSKDQVAKDLSTVHEKGRQSREVVRYNLSNYTKPETAIPKLIDKFGAEWSRQLAIGLLAALEDR